MASARVPLTDRHRKETELVRKREKQFKHDQIWDGRTKYYEHWNKTNTKFDEWTSPRYHATNNALIAKIKSDREREERLEKRRNQLRQLFHEEDKQYQYELMVHKTEKAKCARKRLDTSAEIVSTEVLKELNIGLKLEAEDRRKHEAELKLYHQWRNNNPIIKHYERMQSARDLKLSWLDQQIELNMRKAQEEEECRRILKEREKLQKEQEEKERIHQENLIKKRTELKNGLDEQIEQLKQKTVEADELRQKEQVEIDRIDELKQLELLQIEEKKKKSAKECALYNIKQYKFKLKKKLQLIEEELDEQRKLVEKLKKLDICDRIECENKKQEMKKSLDEFLDLVKQQKELEVARQRHFDFMFESESKYQFEQQEKIWKEEEFKREELIKTVLKEIQEQIEKNVEKRREEQRNLIKEQEELVEKIEEFNKELEELKIEETRKKQDFKKNLDEEIKQKQVRKKERENQELKKIDMELERVRKEEERLKREIMNIQKRQGPIRPSRSRIFF